MRTPRPFQERDLPKVTVAETFLQGITHIPELLDKGHVPRPLSMTQLIPTTLMSRQAVIWDYPPGLSRYTQSPLLFNYHRRVLQVFRPLSYPEAPRPPVGGLMWA